MGTISDTTICMKMYLLFYNNQAFYQKMFYDIYLLHLDIAIFVHYLLSLK